MDDEVQGNPTLLAKDDEGHAVKLQKCIQSQIRNYEDLLQLITRIQASHAQVFKSMDLIVHAHAIPSLGTLT